MQIRDKKKNYLIGIGLSIIFLIIFHIVNGPIQIKTQPTPFIYGTTQRPQSFDPLNASDQASRDIIINCFEGLYFVQLKSSPEGNRANMELLKVLEKYFGKPVKIRAGYTNRKKIIEVLD